MLGYEGGTTEIDNGVHFTDVVTELVKKACPNLTVKSDFFQINTEFGKNFLSTYNGGEITFNDTAKMFQIDLIIGQEYTWSLEIKSPNSGSVPIYFLDNVTGAFATKNVVLNSNYTLEKNNGITLRGGQTVLVRF